MSWGCAARNGVNVGVSSAVSLSSGAFTPASLFAGGVKGAWYDVGNRGTVFTDAAMTTLASVGDSVAAVADLSGNGNHAKQTTAGYRPILRQDATTGLYYLQFDGVDDYLTVTTFDMSATDKAAVCVGVKKTSAAAAAMILGLSVDAGSNNGAFYLYPNSTTYLRYLSRGTSNSSADLAGGLSTNASVVTGISSISGNSNILRVNGAQVGSSGAGQGTGNYGASYPLFIGAHAGTALRLAGNIYQLTIVNAALSARQIGALETWTNRKTGAY